MLLTAKILLFAVIFPQRLATALDIGLSTKCVVIPKEMGMCHNIGYSEMRLPNLMGHTSMAEVILKSTTWQHLVHTDCHPHVRTFLCSLFAPICLDTFIHPCRSMCAAVRDSCAPALLCHGHRWPASLACDRFPADEDMCLAPLTRDYKHLHKGSSKVAEGRVAVPCAPGNQGDTGNSAPRRSVGLSVQSSLAFLCTCSCRWVAEWQRWQCKLQQTCSAAMKVKLSKKRTAFEDQEYNIECQVEFITQGSLLPYETQSMIQQWLLINEKCIERMTPTHRPMVYLLVGNIEEGIILVKQIYRWQRKDSQLTVATQKWRYHKCL
ncbi:Secreted frizzled-related protein 2 [Lonchura striata]|uniref:Secreted frizzled-related protein 2 n=1 Tax=Lonchura striata TaxID=40157 RepID=A0A218UYD3_9PASE|nr:Secreted frizzled-related protein 2 [Lonchura striata domestica]